MKKNGKDTPGEKLRWTGFFVRDRLKDHGLAKRQLEADLYAYRHGTSVQETRKKLGSLIDHAVRTTGFYKDYDPRIPLEQLPVVDKDTFRNHYREFLSSDYTDAKDNRLMSTSGSTGTPLTMVQNHSKAVCDQADGAAMGVLAGYRIGEKMAMLRVWVRNVQKGKLQQLAENSIMMDSSSLSDDSMQSMLDVLKREKVKCLIGYASAIGELSDYIRRNHISTEGFSLHSIIPISETMPDPVRKQLQEQFGLPVQSWYSNEENGIMGVQEKYSDAYYINSESYYYEILKLNSDEPAENGEVGRIVITDLNNYAFPVIRYANGDTAAARYTEKDGRFRLELTELYGRRSDMLYDTQGRAVTPYVITNNLWNVDGVRQYQFIQDGIKAYTLKLNGDKERMDLPDILGRIRPYLGEDAEIQVEFVQEIPVLASGKRKYIENHCPEYVPEIRRQHAGREDL